MTIATAFSDFLVKLTPSEVETEKARSHRESIYNCLSKNYTVENFFRTGSFGNGTSISGFSDVDYFLVVPTKELKKNSYSSLNTLCKILSERFPETDVEISIPAVCLPFGTDDWETTEITIADLVRESNGIKVYDIPNFSSGWMRSSPTSLREFINKVDEQHNGKLKPLIRYIKAWKYYNSAPISSFYLELFITRYAQSEETIVYTIDIKEVIQRLINSNLEPIEDPLGISSNKIEACSNRDDLNTAFRMLTRDLTYCERALEHERQEQESNAIAEWDKFYNGQFI